MKKLFTVSLLALSVGATSSVMAEQQKFAGVGFGFANLNYNVENNEGWDKDDSESSNELYLRAGAILNNDIRAYGTLSMNDFDGLDQTSVTGSVDKIFPIQDKFSAYAGGTLGFTSFDNGSESESGVVYGLQAGVLFSPTEKITVDAGYAYSFTTAEYEYNIPSINYKSTLSLESVSALRVGVDFAF